MTSTSRSSISSEPTDINFAYFLAKPFVAWHPLVAGVHSWMQTCSVAQASIQKEWFAFVERRLHADAEQMQRLNHAKADDTWRLCYEFYEKAVEDYRIEYGHLATLGSNLLSETVSGTVKTFEPSAIGTEAPRPASKPTEVSARRAEVASR